jgi:hypothetical protein
VAQAVGADFNPQYHKRRKKKKRRREEEEEEEGEEEGEGFAWAFLPRLAWNPDLPNLMCSSSRITVITAAAKAVNPAFTCAGFGRLVNSR